MSGFIFNGDEKPTWLSKKLQQMGNDGWELVSVENIEFDLNYPLYQLLEDNSYLKTAYNQVQEKASAMEKEIAAKFLSYPIPKAIVEEWEKVK